MKSLIAILVLCVSTNVFASHYEQDQETIIHNQQEIMDNQEKMIKLQKEQSSEQEHERMMRYALGE